jgi:hypothetical protein
VKILFDSKRRKISIKLVIETFGEQDIVITAFDPQRANTVYTDRLCRINGKEEIEIPFPSSPDHVMIEIYNRENGDLPTGEDKTFKVISVTEQHLKQWLGCIPKESREAIKFFDEFNERAGWLGAGDISSGGSIYRSDDGKYQITYLDNIVDTNTHRKDPNSGNLIPNPNYMQILRTPLRTSEDDGRMEIAKARYKDWTIAERDLFSYHEWAHVFKNKNARDEFEADLNALIIYLAKGGSKYEALAACYDVFSKSPSDQNMRRWKVCEQFILNWETWVKKHCE